MAARGKRALLAYIAPCDPTEVDAPPEGSDWIHKIKWDGYRAQVHIDGPRIGRTPGARRWPAADGALMGSQLPVAANRTRSFERRPDARDRLEQLRVDQRAAKAELREAWCAWPNGTAFRKRTSTTRSTAMPTTCSPISSTR